jgi:hypothetical protein
VIVQTRQKNKMGWDQEGKLMTHTCEINHSESVMDVHEEEDDSGLDLI